ncbi:MAG: type I secretion system permease/ATPase [Hyphomicrobiales bacterium]|nr:type I secretion system permease/ATPase [Hyphomicrobiales bacterium]
MNKSIASARPANWSQQRSRVSAAFAACRSAFLGLAGFSLVINLLMLTGPIFMLQIYDRVLTSGSVPTLIALAVLAAGLYAFLGILEYIRSRILVRIGRRLDEQLGDISFDSAVLLASKLGRKAERLDPVRDLDQVRHFLSGPGPLGIFDAPWMPLYLGIIFIFHPLLGYLAVAGAVLLVILTLINELLSRGPLAESSKQAVQRARLVEAGRRNSEVLSAMGMLRNIREVWIRNNESFLEIQAKTGDRVAFFGAITKTSRFVLQSAMLGVGAYLVIQQAISPGVMIAGAIILTRALAPVEQAIAHWRGFVSARQSLTRLRSVLDKMPETDTLTPLPLPEKQLSISNVCVAPPGEQTLTLQGISLSLTAGDGMGIIGPSGSGKSTLARTLVGAWPVAKGEVRLDGATLDQWQPDVLGRSIGYLPQNVELFEGTVADNIARFSPEHDEDALINAARLAGVHDMILHLADGYDTDIGESGQVLSAGQRQRIGLARALYGHPFLVVLDEPNSNLDTEGDIALLSAVNAMRELGSIVVLISHRPSAVSGLNKLLMLKDGRQQDFGPKSEVLAKVTRPKAAAAAAAGLTVVKD